MRSSVRELYVGLVLAIATPLGFSTTVGAVVFNPDGAVHDPTQQSGWALPAVDNSFTDRNNCLRCHQAGGIAAIVNPKYDKSSYLFGGHKNISRLADGKKWGIPGVDASHPANPDQITNIPDLMSLATNGFTNLWIQEDYPRMPVDWATGTGAASSSTTNAYCAKDSTGAISTD